VAFNPRLFDIFDESGIWIMGDIIDVFNCAISECNVVNDAWSSCDDIEIEFSLQAFEDNFKMQKA